MAIETSPKTEKIQKVVRSVLVSLTSPEELYEQLSGQGNITSALRFYIGMKGDNGNKRYTLFGGKVNEGESWPEATQREIQEEISVNFLGIPKQTILGTWEYSSKKSGEREAILTYNPSLPMDKRLIGDPKISKVVQLDFEEFKKLISEGAFNNIPMEGHLAVDSKDDINIDGENNKKKDYALKKSISWMSHIEEYLKKKFGKMKGLSKEDFLIEYEKELSRFMKRGIETSLKTKEIKKEGHHQLIEALDNGYLGRDILYYLPEIAKHGFNWVGLENSTEGVKFFINYIREVFESFLPTINMTSEQYSEFIKDHEIILEKKLDIMNKLDIHFKKSLKKIFSNITDEDLNEALSKAQDFFKNIFDEMKVADPKLREGLYQENSEINEVNNSNFGNLLNLFLGYDHKENSSEADNLIKFESGRRLILFFKSLAGIKHYQREIKNVRKGKIQNAVNSFFGSVAEEEVIKLENQKMRIRRRNKNGKKLIVDEKIIKTFTSFLRKSFEENIDKILDFHNVNVVFLNESFNVESITDALKTIEQFIFFLKEQYPSCNVNNSKLMMYGTNNFREEIIEKKGDKVDAYGKRQGSQGDKMVRVKTIIKLDDEVLEFVVYPYYSLKEQSNSRYWGWKDKIEDDKDYTVRRLLAGKNGFPSLYDLLFPPSIYPNHYEHRLKAEYHK